jgi:hypothetical protein
MSTVFPKVDSATEQHLLEAAYQKARKELIDGYNMSPAKLDSLVEPMTVAISDLFYAGERDLTRLADYAVYRALQNVHLPLIG